MARCTSILVVALVLTGCGKASKNTVAAPIDPITRFVAGYSNIYGSIVYSSIGGPSTMSAEQALAKLTTNGVEIPRITNLSVVEVRALRPEDPHLARRLTNSVAALVDTEIGQKIILLRQFPGERDWSYHVFDSK
jgi:hypothetical protein